MSEPIRVLHVVQRMEAAGVQTLLMNLYRNIDRSKVQFDFLVHYEAHQFFDDEIEAMGGHIYRLSFREDFNVIKYLKDLDTFFSEHKEYKVVHGHMHSLGAIYLHYAKKYGVPTRIAHSHTNATQNDEKKALKLIMNKLYQRNATDLFACSDVAGKYMFGDNPFTVINNAIDTRRFFFTEETREQKRNELGLENKVVIGNVGRFEIQKNQKFTVDVFEVFHRRHPDSVLLLIGTGSMEKEIKEKVHEHGLDDCVMFLGNRKDVAELYMAMDVFLFPSLFEGLGIVAVEAQAAGTPVVCTDSLPKEINVTELIKRLSLADPLEIWAKSLEQASTEVNAHCDMREQICSAKYDIVDLANCLQQFYIEHYA